MDISQKQGKLILPDRSFSHREFKADVLRFSDELQEKGLTSDTRVILKCSNSYTFCVALFSLMHLNTSIVLMDVEMNANDMNDVQTRTHAKWFLTDDEVHVSDPACIQMKLPCFEEMTRPQGQEERDISLEGWFERRDAVILFSSGSTGRPKGIVKSGKSIFYNKQATAEAMQYRADDVLLPMVPFFNTWGFFLLIIWWLTGCSLFICNYRFTGNLTRYLINHSVTVVEATISTTYSTLQLLKSRPDLLQKVKNSSLRMWYTSGAPVSDSLKGEFYQHLGQPLLDYYGSSEAGNLTAGNLDDSVATGRVISGVEVKIVDSEGKELPPGKVGDVYAKGNALMEGYLVTPEEYRLDLKDGWMDMKDFGYFDEAGHLYVLGRKDNAIHRMGSTFYTCHMERMVEELGVLAEVVALPDERKGSYLVLFVQYPKADISSIRKKILKSIPTYMYPDKLICMDEFPFLPMGKIDKKQLERKAQELCAPVL
ncbi:acyl--CoA ligase [Kroppenstedtia pulmonis]|uniref:Acyl--CoA ligase n=1 Tax=Kroppenstedtia pulmonis TaxID=1380685 RepID=A0A7D3XSR1_9BACL|nr:class I adenylate-forming enzyme family protein [Kroppenstedtia pulmonis]QKG85268.1 acyl--CoA ligase [Kroppenstedtia pulmonis]